MCAQSCNVKKVWGMEVARAGVRQEKKGQRRWWRGQQRTMMVKCKKERPLVVREGGERSREDRQCGN